MAARRAVRARSPSSWSKTPCSGPSRPPSGRSRRSSLRSSNKTPHPTYPTSSFGSPLPSVLTVNDLNDGGCFNHVVGDLRSTHTSYQHFDCVAVVQTACCSVGIYVATTAADELIIRWGSA